MKKILRLFQFILCCLCLLPAGNAFAQLVAGESFLKGDYVEVGVAINGAYGTNNPAPAGYHGRAPGPELGFVSDPDKDGWTVGIPNYCGDYFLPGVPQEGWDIQVGGAWGKAWRDGSGGGGTGFVGAITGTNVDYSSAGGIFKNTWVGAFSGVAIKQQTILKKDKLYFIIKVTLRNTTAATIKEIYYDRTLDPDNTSLMGGLPGVVTSPGPTTVNLIEYKLPNPESRTLVSAVSTLTIEKDKDGGGKDTVDYPVYLGIGSKDCRARPYILGGTLMPLAADSPSRLYRNDAALPATYLFNLGQTNTADAATGLVFHIDSLKPGDSTSFFMAYVLSTADLDTAFKDMSPTWDFDGKEYQSGDTVKICRSSSAPDERKSLNILGGEDYTWTWVPRPGLENTTGTKNSIVVTNTPTTYVVKPSEGFGCVDSMTITIMPYINPVGPSAPSPLFYCQHEKAPPMTASTGGAGVFRWYTTPVGGVGVPSMVPATNVPGTRVYYVSVLNGICESDRTPVTVITRKLPTVDGFTEKAPSACAAKDGSINFRVDSANKPYTVFFDKDGEAQTPVVFTSDATGRFTLTGLGGGSYGAFYVIDQYGCKSLPFYGPVDLIDPVPAGPPIVNNGPLCVGGKLELTAPLLDGVTYKWTGPNGFSSTDRSPELEDVTEASGGDYVLIVTKGTCVYRASRTTLEIAPTPKHQQFTPKALCEGTDLKVELLREPGTSYAWTGHGVNQFDQDLLVSPVSLSHSGYYLVTATSGVGCITLDSVEVRVDKKQTVSYGGDTSICSGDYAQLYVQTDGAGVQWSPAGSLDNATALTPKASPTTKTEYQVVAHSGTTCPDITGKVNVDVIPAPSVRAYDTLVRMDVPYTIMPVYGQDAVKWHWEPADNLSCSDCPNPVFTSRNDMTYTVYVSNNLGCTSADTVTIRVFCDGASVTMPNAFTPNGDGKNDLYYVRGKGFAVKRFIIYNRLGQEVFHKENFLPNDVNYGWDGTLSGTQITEAAGFVYLLEVQCYGSTNEPMVMKGTVLLIR